MNKNFKRSDSFDFSDPSALDPNTNLEWVRHRSSWAVYAFVCFAYFTLFKVFGFSSELCITITNITHTAVSFTTFHVFRGTPLDEGQAQGKYDDLTFWEQLSQSANHLSAQKFFILVPVVIFFVSTVLVNDTLLFTLNAAASLLVLIPKLYGFF
eukprot:gb/GECH01008350.1/.p1 GENE.gb/GECH01008350.1/~~gb/GECH01008350.1/.p1  ORF type:complete len:154 (+),score=18.70 gb/GECH01008350.1/:1-462(+)